MGDGGTKGHLDSFLQALVRVVLSELLEELVVLGGRLLNFLLILLVIGIGLEELLLLKQLVLLLEFLPLEIVNF